MARDRATWRRRRGSMAPFSTRNGGMDNDTLILLFVFLLLTVYLPLMVSFCFTG